MRWVLLVVAAVAVVALAVVLGNQMWGANHELVERSYKGDFGGGRSVERREEPVDAERFRDPRNSLEGEGRQEGGNSPSVRPGRPNNELQSGQRRRCDGCYRFDGAGRIPSDRRYTNATREARSSVQNYAGLADSSDGVGK